MRITGYVDTRTCAICGRSLLMGERAVRYAPEGDDFVDVCPLCQDVRCGGGLVERGEPDEPGRRGRAAATASRPQPRHDLRASAAAADRARRLRADPAPALAARAGNGRGRRPVQRERVPAYRRGDRKEPRSAEGEHPPDVRGQPRGRRHGRLGPVLVPVPSRVRLGAAGAARGAGYELRELDQKYRSWNARVEDGGRLVPAIERL